MAAEEMVVQEDPLQLLQGVGGLADFPVLPVDLHFSLLLTDVEDLIWLQEQVVCPAPDSDLLFSRRARLFPHLLKGPLHPPDIHWLSEEIHRLILVALQGKIRVPGEEHIGQPRMPLFHVGRQGKAVPARHLYIQKGQPDRLRIQDLPGRLGVPGKEDLGRLCKML